VPGALAENDRHLNMIGPLLSDSCSGRWAGVRSNAIGCGDREKITNAIPGHPANATHARRFAPQNTHYVAVNATQSAPNFTVRRGVFAAPFRL